MEVGRDPEEYVFASVRAVPPDVRPVATVEEAEGTTLVLRRADAERLGLAHDLVLAPADETVALLAPIALE